MMESALDRADEVMAEGRDRVVNLHSCLDQAGDLAQSRPAPAMRLRTEAK